jgi:beta-mannosidase
MKGGNYIPPDMFMPRVNYTTYNKTLSAAIESNYNMLRVWGGGNYENQTFYDLCDQEGILIW